jgi:hypothetical protein
VGRMMVDCVVMRREREWNGHRIYSLSYRPPCAAEFLSSDTPASTRTAKLHSQQIKQEICVAQQRSFPQDWLKPRALVIGMCQPPAESEAMAGKAVGHDIERMGPAFLAIHLMRRKGCLSNFGGCSFLLPAFSVVVCVAHLRSGVSTVSTVSTLSTLNPRSVNKSWAMAQLECRWLARHTGTAIRGFKQLPGTGITPRPALALLPGSGPLTAIWWVAPQTDLLYLPAIERLNLGSGGNYLWYESGPVVMRIVGRAITVVLAYVV